MCAPRVHVCIATEECDSFKEKARQLTDAYLLALAVHHRGRLVTLDGGVAIQMVQGAIPAHLLRLLPP